MQAADCSARRIHNCCDLTEGSEKQETESTISERVLDHGLRRYLRLRQTAAVFVKQGVKVNQDYHITQILEGHLKSNKVGF